ncbi:DUF2628 domain-containing protein [Xanthobacter sp. KR7-65]|uniref:DUF2628 domain-containing protein n=1 Tax=Xanthobacter sp. KR7-65 TaxID=3156612 RepID=UPI0032B61ACD
MATYTVLTRNAPGDTAEAAAGRTVFVREKFSWATLLFAPFVLLRFRLWLAFAAYVAVVVLLGVSEYFGGMHDLVGNVVLAGFHILLAFELPRLRQRKLERLGYEEAGIVIAADREDAEHRFFSAWEGLYPAPRSAGALPAIRAGGGGPTAPTGVIGAFPGA